MLIHGLNLKDSVGYLDIAVNIAITFLKEI